MTNEAKIIKNVILSYPQAEVKDIIINCIYTIIGAVNHLSVPNLKGVPLDIFRLVPQGEGVLPVDIPRLRHMIELKCNNEFNLIYLDHRNVGTNVLESLLTKANQLLKEMIEHEI